MHQCCCFFFLSNSYMRQENKNMRTGRWGWSPGGDAQGAIGQQTCWRCFSWEHCSPPGAAGDVLPAKGGMPAWDERARDLLAPPWGRTSLAAQVTVPPGTAGSRNTRSSGRKCRHHVRFRDLKPALVRQGRSTSGQAKGRCKELLVTATSAGLLVGL